jgi:hypothetical protein
MTTFIELCKRARLECGIAGDGPSSVTGQTGVMAKIVDRTERAWVDIQAQQPYWKFLRATTGPVSLTIATREYTVASAPFSLTTVDKWDRDSSFIYEVDTSDESKLNWITYPEYRQRYRTFPAGRPSKIYEGLDGKIGFDLTPDKAYKVTLDYWQTPERLTSNGHIPACPEQYHDVIVWRSVMLWAGNETASELYKHAQIEYSKVYGALMLDQADMPPHVQAYPLAMGGRNKAGF